MEKSNPKIAGISKSVRWMRNEFYVRVVVPVHLRPLILKKDGTPRTEFQERLGADRKIAEKASHRILAGIHAQIEQAQAIYDASKPTIASAAKAAFRSELDYDLRERTVEQKQSADTDMFTSIYANKLRLVAAGLMTGAEADALIGYAADELIEKKLAVVDSARQRADLLKVLASVRMDSLAASQSRDQGQVYPPEPRTRELLEPDPIIPAMIAATKSEGRKNVSISELFKRFALERTDVAPKTKLEREVAVRMLIDVLGDKAIRDITKEDMLDYKNTLVQTPKNAQQRFPGMTIRQAIQANGKRNEPLPTISATTINDKWLMHLGTMLRWAVQNALLDINPADGVKVAIGKGFKEPTRVPFTQADIDNMFSHSFFTKAQRYEGRHWALLLALYTGARSSSETRRVALTDIYQEDGIDVIALIEATKNVQSKRIVPLHRELIELGFLDYVEELRKKGQEKLFPEWDPDDKYNRWFLRTYKKHVGINDSRKVFHSFRHTLKTALARKGTHRDISDLITGHSDQTVAGGYIADKDRTMVQHMHDSLNRVDFNIFNLLKRKSP